MAYRRRRRVPWAAVTANTALHRIKSGYTDGARAGALVLTVFVACAVEAVEALTIVLAAGLTREWRSTFQGMAARRSSCWPWWSPRSGRP